MIDVCAPSVGVSWGLAGRSGGEFDNLGGTRTEQDASDHHAHVNYFKVYCREIGVDIIESCCFFDGCVNLVFANEINPADQDKAQNGCRAQERNARVDLEIVYKFEHMRGPYAATEAEVCSPKRWATS